MRFSLEQFLGGISVETFLKEYWQKKPLYIKGAINKASQLASFENILEIACDENFETRILREAGGKAPWEATHGPFTSEELQVEDEDKWTLMVHNLELYFEDFMNLRSMLDFIPTWQFDDIMATYSINGASVGAHIDNYNVFIFQGRGRRQWFINETPDTEYIDGLEVKILKNFKGQYHHILEEGDMIYIPPGVAHHGVTLEDSLSYSIGFKSFDYKDMVNSFLGEVLGHYESDQSLRQQHQSKQKNKNELLIKDIDEVQHFFQKEVFSKDKLIDWFGRYITKARVPILKIDNLEPLEISKRLKAKEAFSRDEFLRFNFISQKDFVWLFVNEKKYQLSKSDYQVMEKILDCSRDELITLDYDVSEAVLNIIIELFDEGALFFVC